MTERDGEHGPRRAPDRVIARFRALVAQRLGLQLGAAGHAPLVGVLARRIAATAR